MTFLDSRLLVSNEIMTAVEQRLVRRLAGSMKGRIELDRDTVVYFARELALEVKELGTVLDRLLERGLIQRAQVNKDVAYIALTDVGRQALESSAAPWWQFWRKSA